MDIGQPATIPVVDEIHITGDANNPVDLQYTIANFYLPKDQVRNKHLVGLSISVNTIDPDLIRGDTAIIDLDNKNPDSGDLVIAECEGNVSVYSFKKMNTMTLLANDQGHVDIAKATIHGIVIGAYHKFKQIFR
ncbi:MAG: hypothetical protein NTV30_02780 [Chloroflexi bacterium]|nr:hypothetical protein [Chloroflexota bacterium]